MKKIYVAVKVPNSGKWQIQIGKANFVRSTVVLAYSLIERKIMTSLALSKDVQINLCVNYDQLHGTRKNEWVNEGVYDSATEALYALATFLEDFLSERFLQEKYKKYK